MTVALRGVRGATSVPANDESAIIESTRLMISAAMETNGIRAGEIAAILFTVTSDLDRAFPARAARELGLGSVPLLDFVSPQVPGDLPRLVRMLLLWNTDLEQDHIQHVYLGEARSLRPDLAGPGQ